MTLACGASALFLSPNTEWADQAPVRGLCHIATFLGVTVFLHALAKRGKRPTTSINFHRAAGTSRLDAAWHCLSSGQGTRDAVLLSTLRAPSISDKEPPKGKLAASHGPLYNRPIEQLNITFVPD